MDSKKDFIEPLLQKVEAYSKTSLKIVQFKAIEKTASLSALLISNLLLLCVLSFFLIAINIALALWLGELTGKTYYGFLFVGLFYGIAALFISLSQHVIKRRIENFIITQLLK